MQQPNTVAICMRLEKTEVRKKKPVEYSAEELEAERRLGFAVRGRAA